MHTSQLEMDSENINRYLLEGQEPYPLIIVCPGGGYTHHADHEGEPVAQWLNDIGISALVLKYRISPYQHPEPLQDAQRTIRLARKHANELGVDPERIGILGFSAGGHLAASTGVFFDTDLQGEDDGMDSLSSRPDLMVLCYPVITMGADTHEGSKHALLGADPELALVEKMSLEKQIQPHTPPTFLWHTADDEGVPVTNSLLFAKGLSENKVPYSMHIFESGKHGLGLAEDYEDIKAWTSICETWLRRKGF